MIKVLDKIYMNEKEASVRYGYSKHWFSQRRHRKIPPSYFKLSNSGKVFYPLIETDAWFQAQFNAII